MFLTVGGEIEDLMGSWAVRWRNVVDGAYTTSGAMRLDPPPSDVFEDSVPLRRGVNVITVTGKNMVGDEVTDTLTVHVPSSTITSRRARPAASSTRASTCSSMGPGTARIPDELPAREQGRRVTHSMSASSRAGRAHRRRGSTWPGGGFSTVVSATNVFPMAVERNMIWDATSYGGHGGTAVDAPARAGCSPKASQGFFETYMLLANDNASAVTVNRRFLRESGGPWCSRREPAGAARARTIWAGGVPACPATSFGLDVTATAPIIAERAMYFPSGAAPVRGRHRHRRRVTQPEHALVPRGRRDGTVLRVLHPGQQPQSARGAR